MAEKKGLSPLEQIWEVRGDIEVHYPDVSAKPVSWGRGKLESQMTIAATAVSIPLVARFLANLPPAYSEQSHPVIIGAGLIYLALSSYYLLAEVNDYYTRKGAAQQAAAQTSLAQARYILSQRVLLASPGHGIIGGDSFSRVIPFQQRG